MVGIEVVNEVIQITVEPVTVAVEPNPVELSINTSPVYLPVDSNPIEVFVPTLTGGETSFALPSLPILVHASLLFINGVQQSYGIDYNINSVTLSWLGFPLESTDYLELRYQA